jgi:hypothetical protein
MFGWFWAVIKSEGTTILPAPTFGSFNGNMSDAMLPVADAKDRAGRPATLFDLSTPTVSEIVWGETIKGRSRCS